ncbi:MAG: tetratricopeptide repeat protein [Gemmatimonadota bacterium]|jgi:tetratricopeptide (TPR) repeat protein
MGELFRRLAARRIVQTAAVYAGGAWLLLEATAFFVDNYALSPRILDVAVLLVVLGFPAALIISWFHGEQGRQQLARSEVSLLLTLAVLAAIGTYRISVGGETEAGRTARTPAGSVAPEDLGELSVAVLPFVNSTGQDSLDWLGPGMSDMLTSSLVRTGQLRVVSPQRLFELLRQEGREETERIPDDVAMDIASRSGARRMVRGSILGQPGDLAVDAQLIDLRDGTVVAAERLRGDDVFALSDSVAGRLSTHVAAAVGPRGPAAGGDERLARGPGPSSGEPPRPPIALVGDMEKLREFQVGIRRTWDSLAKDSIGARYHLVELLEQMPGREQEARRALEEIVRLDPGQAKAWSRLARVAVMQGDEVAADSALKVFAEVAGDPVRVATERGRVYESMGRVSEARAAYREALRSEPGATRIMDRLAGTWLRAGDPAGARAAVEPWLASDNAAARAEALLLTGDAWAWEGLFDRALAAYEEAETIGDREGRADIRADALEAGLSIRWVQDTTWGGSRLGRYRSIWTLLELGRLEEARNLVDAAERVQVDEADRLLPVDYHVLLYATGRVYEDLGRKGTAVDAYERLVRNWNTTLASVPRLRDAPERLRRLRG